jgi:probable HAF family extracellular repeat protein
VLDEPGGGPFPVGNTGDVFEQAFSYQNGTTTVLGLRPGEGGIFTAASGINSSGEVVGSGDDAASDERAWKYQNGMMTDIGTLGGPQASATAINTNGHRWLRANQQPRRPRLPVHGREADRPRPEHLPYAINDLGVIVGQGPGDAIVGTAALPEARRAPRSPRQPGRRRRRRTPIRLLGLITSRRRPGRR